MRPRLLTEDAAWPVGIEHRLAKDALSLIDTLLLAGIYSCSVFDPSRISVIIPTYNRADLLREAISSVMQQTVPVHEIVIVDDGSTDATPALLADLLAQGLPLRTVRLEHTAHTGKVRNAGCAVATGAILAFLDSDDLWKPNRIEKQLASWSAKPSAGMAFCNLRRFNDRGLFPGPPYLNPGRDYGRDTLGPLLEEPVVVPSAMMLSRSAFDRVGPFSQRIIVEDYELALEAAYHFPVDYVPDALLLLRDHGGGRASARIELAEVEYIRMIGDFVRCHPTLSNTHKAGANRGLANVHLKLVRLYLGQRRAPEAWKHLGQMARLRPLDGRLPGAVAATVLHTRARLSGPGSKR
ncbi:MAG: glycosyltransferase [Chloroflexota bacterium]